MAQLISWSISPSRSAQVAWIADTNYTDNRKGTGNRTQHQLELEIENMGGHLNAYTSVRMPTKQASMRLTKSSARTLYTTRSRSTTTFPKPSTFSQISSRIRNSSPPPLNGNEMSSSESKKRSTSSLKRLSSTTYTPQHT